VARINVLLIGSGGREHALAWAISASPLLADFYCAPGNPGIAKHAKCVALDIADHNAVIDFCKSHAIDFVVIGPETPLVAGIVDDLAANHIKSFGPSKFAAQLEGSKGFTKDVCAANRIPTAAYQRFDHEDKALAYLQEHGAPIVIKADGLAAGKGVTVAMSLEDAITAVKEIFAGRFAKAECVIEEFLEGEEASLFILSDGKHMIPLATAQDHKRVGEGDTGPNTGGMGAYSPAPCMTEAVTETALEQIVRPTIDALSAMGHPFRGVLYAGLILTREGPKLIEYNVRFGDPETQVIIPRLKDDILTLLLATADGTLDKLSARWRPETALTVVYAAKGYPGDCAKGAEIRGLDQDFGENIEVFHAGTASRDGKLVANGGRVLCLTALGKNAKEAQTAAYSSIEKIAFDGGFYRKDIGWRAAAMGNRLS
jgi:phosphoribosylamine---glycine ligase